MLKTKILFLLFPLILLAQLSSSPDNSAGFIEKTYSFDESLITFEKTNGYDMINIPDAVPLVKPGYPSLPQLGLNFVIPPNATAKTVEVIVNDEKVIPGEFNIQPSQPPVIFSSDGVESAFAEPNPAAYTSKNPYPENLASEPYTGTKCGYRIADFFLSPVQYIPAEKKLTLIKNFTVRVYYDYDNISNKKITPMQKYIFGESVKKMVMNPEDVEISAPQVKEERLQGERGEKLQASGTWEMVIISPNNSYWERELQKLADWKTQKGVRCMVKNVQEIYDDPNYDDVDDPAEIKNFITDMYENHGTIWVLLGADAGVNASNSIPYRGVYAHYQWGDMGYLTYDMPCERYYEDVDGTDWDHDNDGIWGEWIPRFPADVYVGRMCADNYDKAYKHVQRILKYERNPVPNYTRKALFYSSRLAQLIGYHFNGLQVTTRCEWELPNRWFVPGQSGWPPGFHYQELENRVLMNNYEEDGGDHAIIDSMNSGYGFVCEATLGNRDKILAWLGGGEPPPTTTTTANDNGGVVSVCFINDYHFRDLYIEQVRVDGKVRGVDDWLMTNGCKQYGIANSNVIITARGSSGEEYMSLKIGNTKVASWHVSTSSQNYSYTIPSGTGTGYTKPLYSPPTPNNISISTSDIDNWLNPGFKVGIQTGLGCAAGAFDGDCIAEHIYDKGAIGGAWNSEVTIIDFGSSWTGSYSPKLILEFFEHSFNNYHYHLGQAVAEAKDEWMSRASDNAWKWCFKTYNTFGDPELPMWTGNDAPLALSAEHGSTIPNNSNFLVTVTQGGSPVSDVCVTCWCQNDRSAWDRRYTNSSGQVTLNVNTSSGDDIILITATKHNYLPYEGSAQVGTPTNLTLQNETVNAGETKTYEASNSITAAGGGTYFTIMSGGNATMTAGNYISLLPGFTAQEGCGFDASINTSFATTSREIKGSDVPLSYDLEEEKPLKVLSEAGISKGMSTEKSISETLTLSEKEKEDIPKVFSCAQNSPNPFVLSTTINYGLPKDSDVNLVVFNIAGQAVKTLVNANQSAGFKSVSWDGTNSSGVQMPQGIYFYVFRAGDFEKHHKMILLK